MTTKKTERKQLRDSLPKHYSKLAYMMLQGQNKHYSRRTIVAVANCERDNVVIEKVLATLAHQFNKEKEAIKNLSKK